MNQRLALMKDVAVYKFHSKKPIADPEREVVLLRRMEDKARLTRVPAAQVRRFFAAQIEAAKAMQENHFARWEKAGNAPPALADLNRSRIQIDMLNEELLNLLDDYSGKRIGNVLLRQKADERLACEGIDDRVRKLAIEPLLSESP